MVNKQWDDRLTVLKIIMYVKTIITYNMNK